MARSDVLVDWAESNAPNTVFVEVDEDTSAYDGGHIAAVKLDWRPMQDRSCATSSTPSSSRKLQ